MIWMLDTDTVGYLINRAPGVERIKRRLSGRSPGEARLSLAARAVDPVVHQPDPPVWPEGL